jgi:phospholipid/cholesterol/gamma-HCH transport system permease protein
MNVLASIGAGLIGQARGLAHLVSVVATAVRLAARPRYWRPTVRDVLARQIYFTGIEAVRWAGGVGVLVGVAVVAQAQVWLHKAGQSALIGPLLVAVVIRELGPLLTNFIVIGRSGTAIASELAAMRINGEIRVLDAQGMDPFTYLVVPRVIGVMLSVFCLTIVFLAVSFAGGFLAGALAGLTPGQPGLFADTVLKAVSPSDALNVLAKTLIPGAFTGAICCIEGLSVEGAATEIPKAAGRAVLRSVGALFLVSALVSVMTYL